MGVDAERGELVTSQPTPPDRSARRVVVIGAGPAGLMAADVLSAHGIAVDLYDRMPSPARKLLIAGRGGLNLTHSEPLVPFLGRYAVPEAGKAIFERALRAFPPEALIAFAHGLGQETFVGSSGRVFPTAMKASPLLRAWLRRLAERGVGLQSAHEWRGWTADGKLELADLRAPGTPTRLVEAGATILALGGGSWPRLGSNGAWVDVLERAGVRTKPLAPSNCGVLVSWSAEFTARHAGQPLKRIAIMCAGRTSRGEALITQSGLEGGAVYALSQSLRSELSTSGSCTIHIDLLPDVPLDELSRRLAGPRGKQSIANVLRKTTKLSPAALALLSQSRAPRVDEPGALAAKLKALPFEVRGLAGLERAISTAGGILFDEIDEHFMLRARPGAFVAGEMLDWDAPTGGYLLQASFATAMAAAMGALRYLGVEAARRAS